MNIRFIVLAAAAFLSACATARIDVAYKPTRAPQKLVVARMPRILLAEVEDRAPAGLVYSGAGLTTNGRLTRPMVDTVRDALRIELGRLGVPLAVNRSEADAVLKAAVTALSCVIREGANVPMNASLSVALQLRALDGAMLWSNEVTGQGSKIVLAPGFPGSAPSESMNAALAAVMSKMSQTFDEEGTLARVFRAPASVAAAPVAVRAPIVPAAPTSDVDELPAARAQSKRRHAIVIGVERYRENLPKADFAAGDAKLAAEYFKRVLGVPEENLALLVDDHTHVQHLRQLDLGLQCVGLARRASGVLGFRRLGEAAHQLDVLIEKLAALKGEVQHRIGGPRHRQDLAHLGAIDLLGDLGRLGGAAAAQIERGRERELLAHRDGLLRRPVQGGRAGRGEHALELHAGLAGRVFGGDALARRLPAF